MNEETKYTCPECEKKFHPKEMVWLDDTKDYQLFPVFVCINCKEKAKKKDD